MVAEASAPSQTDRLVPHSPTGGARDSEGLQSVDYDGRNAPQVYDPASEGLQFIDHDGRDGSQFIDHDGRDGSQTLVPGVHPDASYTKTQPTMTTTEVSQSRRKRKRRLIWAIIIAIVVAIAAAVGVGAGVGLTRDGDGDKAEINDSDAVSVTASSPKSVSESSGAHTATSSPTTTASSATETFATSGTTGIADYRCNDTETIEAASGTNYTQECKVYYTTNKNRVSPLPIEWLKNVRDNITAYSFEECIEECEAYNESRGQQVAECLGLSFFGNLDDAFTQMGWNGNCFLKNGRGERAVNNAGDMNYAASAWRSCLSGSRTAAESCGE